MSDLKPHEKYSLTVKEAVAYFGIGETLLRKLIKANPKALWHFNKGTNIEIKRVLFEKYLDNVKEL